ncbi:diguanylate cyclase [Thiorhodococcus drewsii AZ1]|uniref:diguanylate cyclase n=1 Tax=Thiorhodococcus drewsii AZ1 TaxID=765913 RepID=G2E0J8_9GAMM|nr:diguanylate cyclase [Thiorhodococcus drewsii]EGV31926.1 diguanylate cyclase [Thiorhodococcus drewsii AZ1]
MDITSSAESHRYDEQVAALQIAQSYRQLPIGLLVTVANGLILTTVLWNAIDGMRLAIWLTALLAVTLGRFALVLAYHNRRQRQTHHTQSWERYFILGSLASGLTWGFAGIILFSPNSFPHQVFLAFTLGGMIAGAVPVLSSLPPSFHAFLIPTLSPITLQMLIQGDSIHTTMGVMLIIFALAMTASSARVYRLSRETAELRLKLSQAIEDQLTLNSMARLDPLTGLGNRRLFDETLNDEWKRALRTGNRFSLIMADIDYFKRYNDCLGHLAGDACLTRVAKAMAAVAKRPGDKVARIGDEEFAFLLPNTPSEDALGIAEQVRQRIEALRIKHPNSPIADHVTISLGAADLIPNPGRVPSDLIEAADTALYAAKRQGRNCVVRAL